MGGRLDEKADDDGCLDVCMYVSIDGSYVSTGSQNLSFLFIPVKMLSLDHRKFLLLYTRDPYKA